MNDRVRPDIAAAVVPLVISRRSSVKVLRAILNDPLAALPPEVFTAPLVRSSFFGRPRFHVLEPSLIQDALLRNAELMTKGADVQRVLGPALGEGLLTADGAHWRWQRQSAAPIFQHDRLTAFLPAMVDAAARTRDRWLALAPGTSVDISHEMMQTTFDIIVATMLSGEGNVDAARVERGMSAFLSRTGWMFVLSMVRAPRWTPFPGKRQARLGSRYLRAEMGRAIAERRATGTSTGGDLLDHLIAAKDPESGRTMRDSNIVDNLLTFISAGHETTAQSLAWTFYLLSRHPDIEAEVLAEIARVTQGEPVSADHVGRLIFTKQVLQESMRLYPPAPVISRITTGDFELGGHVVPAGTKLFVPIYAVHRHKALWRDPETFDPTRFAPAAVRTRHRYAYMPFGAGSRICIGSAFAMMEAVAILATLLRSVRLTCPAGIIPRPLMRITLRPAEPLHMGVQPRPA